MALGFPADQQMLLTNVTTPKCCVSTANEGGTDHSGKEQSPPINAHPLMPPDGEAFAGDGLPVADALDERVADNSMGVLACRVHAQDTASMSPSNMPSPVSMASHDYPAPCGRLNQLTNNGVSHCLGVGRVRPSGWGSHDASSEPTLEGHTGTPST